MQIANFKLTNPLILAPMAGVTDRPFRQLCKKLGAGMTVSEMVGANSLVRGCKKTLQRAYHGAEDLPRSVQIVGADPYTMGLSAKINQDLGAEIIDINMGCPAKKICNVLAGSALLRDPVMVAKILQAVVESVTIPVTLKIRTGWDHNSINAVAIAKIAESSGVKALAIHGRTRSDLYNGNAEYDTIAQVKQAIKIPVIANGDITNPQKAKAVLDHTKADALMIGRAALGNPWIFREIWHYLTTGAILAPPTSTEIINTTLEHLDDLYAFYGERTGVMMARKHISWYSKGINGSAHFRSIFNTIDNASEQRQAVTNFFN